MRERKLRGMTDAFGISVEELMSSEISELISLKTEISWLISSIQELGLLIRELTVRVGGLQASHIVLQDNPFKRTKLGQGADDYVTKPSNSKRPKMFTSQDDSLLTLGDVTIEPGIRRVTIRGKKLKLTPTEHDLLYLLARNGGRMLTHKFLLSRIWGEEHANSLNYLKVYIQRLRNKIEEDPKNPKIILTQRGGYSLAKR